MALTGLPPAVFMRDGNPQDPRSQRTRSHLLETFEAMVRAGEPIESVAALVRIAGVSRSSFYNHFSSIDEVGVAALREVLSGFDGPREQQESISQVEDPVARSTASLLDLFQHLELHRELCVVLLDAQASTSATARTELQAVLVKQFMNTLRRTEGVAPVDVATSSTFIAAGIVSLLEGWLKDPQFTAEHFATTIWALMPSWLADLPDFERPLRVTRNNP